MRKQIGIAVVVGAIALTLAACGSAPHRTKHAPVPKQVVASKALPPDHGVSEQAEARQRAWLLKEGIPAAEVPAFLYQPTKRSTEFGFDLVAGVNPNMPKAQLDLFVGHAMRYSFAHWYAEDIVLSAWTATNRKSVWFATLNCETGYWSHREFHIARTTTGTLPAGTVVLRPEEKDGKTVMVPHRLTHAESQLGPFWPVWTFFHMSRSTFTYFDEPGPTNACNAPASHPLS